MATDSYGSKGNREWKRDNGQTVVFNPYYLAGNVWGEPRESRSIKYFYWLKSNPSVKYASFIKCIGYKGLFSEDGGVGDYHRENFVRFKRQKTYAQKEGLKIANEFCPQWNDLNRSVFVDIEFNDWDEDVLIYDYELENK